MNEPTANPILSVRLPADLIARVDEYAAQEQASAPGRKCSRTDAVRMLLLRGLDAPGKCNDTRRGKGRK